MIVETLIAQLCSEVLLDLDREACTKAFTAASVQTHVAQDVGFLEKKIGQLVYKEVEDVTGREFLGVTGFVVHTVRSKRIQYTIIKQDGVFPTVTPSATPSEGIVNLNWRF